jgi:hypothetical protein
MRGLRLKRRQTMRCLNGICIGVISLLIGANTKAEETSIDGKELLQDCAAVSPGNPFGIFGPEWCYGYLMGVNDMRMLSQTSPHLIAYCIPKGVRMGQVKSVVMKYLQEHPKELHSPSVALVNKALEEAFPCKAQPAPQ